MADEDVRNLVRRAFEADVVRPANDWIDAVQPANADSRRLGRSIAIVLVLSITVFTAASLTMALHVRTSGPSTATDGALYTVTAQLLSVGGGPVYACRILQWSLPPTGCSGVEVSGVDIPTVSGATRYPNGTVVTPTVKLVGKWQPPLLVLTEPPKPSTGETSVIVLSAGKPQPFSTTMPASAEEVDQKLRTDIALLRGQGILIESFGWDGTNLELVLVQGTRSNADYLTKRYGAIKIEAWLHPL